MNLSRRNNGLKNIFFMLFGSAFLFAQDAVLFKQFSNQIVTDNENIYVNNLFNELESADSTNFKKAYVFGLGLSELFIILPLPYFEGGIRCNSIDFKANIGTSITLEYFETKIEIAYLTKIKRLDVIYFLNGGLYLVRRLTGGYYSGLGFDINFINEHFYFRFETGVMKDYYANSGIYIFPRIGIGWRTKI